MSLSLCAAPPCLGWDGEAQGSCLPRPVSLVCASIHYLKCSLYLHWERIHHITFKTQYKGRSMKQFQVQKWFLRSSWGWDGHWGDGRRDRIQDRVCDVMGSPGSTQELLRPQVTPLSPLLTKMHKGWGNTAQKEGRRDRWQNLHRLNLMK